MSLSRNPLSPSLSLPTQAAIERRRRELLAYQAQQHGANPVPASGEPAAAASVCLEEDFPPEQDPEQDLDQAMQQCFEQAEAFLEAQEPLAPSYPAEANVDSYANADSYEDTEPLELTAQPAPTLAEEALYGLAGLTVCGLAPHTEADPAAVLLQFLAAFGNLIGRAPHCRVGPTRHGLNLFLVLVGESSKARKGTSWRQISHLFAEVDPDWAADRVLTDRPSARIILSTLAEQPGNDLRLFLLAEEFASVLQVLARENGQLSPLLRCAWDGGNLAAHNGHRVAQAAGPHISLVGHITQGELAPLFGRAESHNGFANRCLWAAVRRTRFLPEGGGLPPDDQAALAEELRRVLGWIRTQNELVFTRTPAARELWNHAYADLVQGRADAYGAATSRAEAQVLRLSALYAALDATALVDVAHLRAALAVWDYCRASARLLFDTAPIDPIARRINHAIGTAPDGLSRKAIRALFHGHVSKERIDLALQQLTALGLTYSETAHGRGRATNLWAKAPNHPAGNEVGST